MKKVKINSKKLKRNIIYIGIISIFLVAIIIFPSTLSRFQSKGNGEAKVDLAFSLLDTDELTSDIKLEDVLPDGKIHEYSFSIKNYDDEGNRIDVILEYDITMKVTTNLPIKYNLYDSEGNLMDISLETIKDDDGTYFNVYKTDKRVATYKEDTIETYTIKYSLDSIYSDYKYQDIMELLSIEINVKQIV